MSRVDPFELERMVLVALERRGFHQRLTQRTRDNGLDGVLYAGGLAIGVQVKRKRQAIGSVDMRTFIGSLHVHDLAKGLFVTTGSISRVARDQAQKAGVEIMEGHALRDMLFEHAWPDVARVIVGD